MTTRDKIIDLLQAKMKDLNDTLWEDKARWPHVEKWLSQFSKNADLENDEQVQLLFLATHFMYFGVREIRTLLRSLFRDIYQYQMIEEIRRTNNDTLEQIQVDFTHSLHA
jgi:hypothetical protein